MKPRRRRLGELTIRVTTRASRTRLEVGETLKVYVTSPPVDGEANDAVVEFLGKCLQVPKSSLAIVRGSKSRDKVVRIDGLSTEQIKERLGLD